MSEQENIKLNKNEFVPVDINEDHVTHLQIHAKADDSKSAIVHIEAHKKAMMMKREMEQEQAALAQESPPSNPTNDPLSVQQMPQMEGVGSAPANKLLPENSVQQ